jgi:hypothetical protein
MTKPEMKIIRVKRFENSFEANLYKSKLESAGIECFLTNENLTDLVPYYTNMLNMGIDLMVGEGDYDSALNIINDNKTESLSDKVCPNCKSLNVVRKYGKHNFPKWIVFIISLVAFIPIVYRNYTLFCKNCNCEFGKI